MWPSPSSCGDLEQLPRYKKAQWFPDQRRIQWEPRICHISMETILVLASFLHISTVTRATIISFEDPPVWKSWSSSSITFTDCSVAVRWTNDHCPHSSLAHSSRWTISSATMSPKIWLMNGATSWGVWKLSSSPWLVAVVPSSSWTVEVSSSTWTVEVSSSTWTVELSSFASEPFCRPLL
jgi:hypothetical protein